MIGFSTLIIAWIAWIGKTIGIKLGLIVIALATVTTIILATKLAFAALLAAVPLVPLPGYVVETLTALIPNNFQSIVELLINARVLLLIYSTQWIYVKLYINAASWKIV